MKSTGVRALRWIALTAGAAMVLFLAVFFIHIAQAMDASGGIPWSWSLIERNAHWLVWTLLAAVVAGWALYGLVRARRRTGKPI